MRLTAEIWVSAYLTRLRQIEVPAFIVQKGDATAGAVLIKLNTLDGQACCYQRSFDLMTGARKRMVPAKGAGEGAFTTVSRSADELSVQEVDASVAKQRSFDPDLWVIEVEDKDGRHLLDEPGLE